MDSKTAVHHCVVYALAATIFWATISSGHLPQHIEAFNEINAPIPCATIYASGSGSVTGDL